jgi:DNA-directed RNA polymerase specialized sigma24 family protein
MDVCQDVWASFFLHAPLAAYDMARPAQLVGLLRKMAAHKLADWDKYLRRERRDIRRVKGGGLREHDVAGRDPTPSRQVAVRELLGRFWARLTEQERSLVRQRAAGRSWAEIAAECGSTPEAVRMRWRRGVQRVARELRLKEFLDD